MKADQWAALKVSSGDAVICDNSDTAAEGASEEDKATVKANDCPAAGNHNVSAKTGEGATGNELTADAEAGTECTELKKAEPAATTGGDTTGGDTTGGDTTGGDTTGETTTGN